jgi:hypothetical protein
MSDYEILKHVPEVAKAASVVAASVPFTAIVKRMLGPAADEVADRIRDEIRVYRYGRQLECLKKAEKMAIDAGFTPKAVPIKLLFPLLEGASLEENEDLHTMWAALLANASSDKSGIIRPGFISILRDMASDEAELLNLLASNKVFYTRSDFKDRIRRRKGEDVDEADVRVRVCFETLEAAKLIGFLKESGYFVLTTRGREFMKGVNPPRPKPVRPVG